MIGDAAVEARRQVGNVVVGPDSADGEVAGAVVVRGVVARGAIAPAPKVAPVAGGETHTVVFQEIRRPDASGGAQCRLRHHGVALEESRSAIDRGESAHAQFSAQHAQGAPRREGAVLHLRDVAGLVDGKFGDPGHGLRGEGVRDGEQFEAARGPGDLPVGVGRPGVQHHRHLAAVGGVGPHADARSDGAGGLLQGYGEDAAQRIQPAGIDHAVGRRFHAAPAQPARVGAQGVELGGGGQGGAQGREQQ